MKDQALLILTGFSCNNNCIVCSIKTKQPFYCDRKYDDLLKELKKGRNNGYQNVEFTGGEVSIRKDIVELVSRAREMGYKQISFSTNGRIFSYKAFCDKIIGAGLNQITFSLLGPSAKIHDAVTRTPKSFDQIISGIKNVQEFPHVDVCVSSVISKINFRDLKKFASFLIGLGIKRWYLLDLIPDGNAKKYYKSLAVNLGDLSQEINSLTQLTDKFDELGGFDFPICLFEENLREKNNFRPINAKSRMEMAKQVGYNCKRISKNKKGGYSDMHKMHIDICQKCKFNKECGGIWKEHLDIYGSKDLIKLAKKNNCIEND